ncbi:MAG: hypothetical protein K8L99_08140 [Anaerolineae bacterium]|nr:hypothetical protein [Anaerolineae bacterium]
MPMPFAGWFLRVALLLGLLLGGAIAATRLRAGDDTLRLFLLPPEGCAVPCFMGIRPGETRVEAVLRLFDQMPAMSYVVEGDVFDEDSEWVRVNWTYQQPQTIMRGNVYFTRQIARHVTIYDIPLGEIWLALGPPDATQAVTQVLYEGGFPILIPSMHTAYYDAYRLRVDAPVNCGSFWEINTQISVGDYQRRQDSYVERVADHRLQACAASRQQHNGVSRFQRGQFLSRFSVLLKLLFV